MTTQIVFRIDEKLKKSIQKRAKREGITLSQFFKFAGKSFAAGQTNVGFIREPEIPNAKTAKEWQVAMRDIKAGRNLSPAFDNAKDAIAYLKKYAD